MLMPYSSWTLGAWSIAQWPALDHRRAIRNDFQPFSASPHNISSKKWSSKPSKYPKLEAKHIIYIIMHKRIIFISYHIITDTKDGMSWRKPQNWHQQDSNIFKHLHIIRCPDPMGRLGTPSPDWKLPILPMLMLSWPGRRTKKRYVSVILYWLWKPCHDRININCVSVWESGGA